MQYDKVTIPNIIWRVHLRLPQLYVNSAAYVYNEETGEIEMLSQVDTAEDLQVILLRI